MYANHVLKFLYIHVLYVYYITHVHIGMREVPVLAVDIPSLNEQQSRGNERHMNETVICRGLTMSTIGEVRHMTEGGMYRNNAGYFSNGPPQIYRIESVREVTAVLVLFGLPRDLTTSILAHEAMHVWMRLTKEMPYPIPSKIEEGLCQVASRKYLENMCKKNKSASNNSSSNNSKSNAFNSALNNLDYCPEITNLNMSDKSQTLRDFFCYQIETDCSIVYGDGFREANRTCNVLGLLIVLEVVRDTKQLPSI